ncbi:uncharacterized protein LOC114354980 isoform X1 [Ostrinia furnacalis]|uniref:uncharacterized protein LOC114354980 isoform X1 n=1 Tax=Ostrinia furnacalis TaxID=93504 RepID=UPI001040C470|nr:uncharacterized protein LOC114354980 isoform X1 [Ostrinia furnacalis]XP_028163419.1 uncharacterized protein LOC114354980 isoform X1 [Ostrinia furnacalis]
MGTPSTWTDGGNSPRPGNVPTLGGVELGLPPRSVGRWYASSIPIVTRHHVSNDIRSQYFREADDDRQRLHVLLPTPSLQDQQLVLHQEPEVQGSHHHHQRQRHHPLFSRP